MSNNKWNKNALGYGEKTNSSLNDGWNKNALKYDSKNDLENSGLSLKNDKHGNVKKSMKYSITKNNLFHKNAPALRAAVLLMSKTREKIEFHFIRFVEHHERGHGYAPPRFARC